MIHRILNLSKILGKSQSAFLFGARGVGKSALASEFLERESQGGVKTRAINLLESEAFEKYLKQPELLRKEITSLAKKSNDSVTVLIDEVQRIPALLNEVHALLETRGLKVRFLMTGSSARKLKRESANMLAGRAFRLELHPFTFSEWDQDLNDRLRFGSLPGIAYKLLDDDESRMRALRSYVSTYLREEIQQEALVRRLDAFAKFLEIAGQFHGKIVNAATMANAAGVSGHTISEYLQILEDTLIGVKVPGWNASSKKQLRLAPKLFLFDNGVVNAIRGELNVPIRESTTRFGELFEGSVIQELLRLNFYRSLDLKFSYWRTNNDMEVDLILSRGSGPPLAAIEIKSGINPLRKELRGLEAFKSDYPRVPRYCICRAQHAFTSDQGVLVTPWQEASEILEKVAQSQ